MGDWVHVPTSSMKFGKSSGRLIESCSETSPPKIIVGNNFKRLNHLKLGKQPSRDILLFLVKVVALEAVRRLSKWRCPFVWHALQSLQFLTYPPFKWIQRWAPLRNIVKGIKMFSRPLLFLSLATTFSDHLQNSREKSDVVDNPQVSELPTTDTTSELSSRALNRTPEEAVEYNSSNSLLLQVRKDLEKQGVAFPERMDDDELKRFYASTNGDYSLLLKSIKRTIRWRETYGILSPEELESWSHLIFWHGTDMEFRPCLVIRLGLACSSIEPHDRPRLTQAIVSQVEHGVVCLVNGDDRRFTVLLDCAGVSPFGFPVQTLRSCSTLMQDHYPDRLAALFILRLPPIVRVLAHTIIQVLKPTTREKIRIVGEQTYREVLSSYVKSVPSFLGGKCACSRGCISPRPPTSRCRHIMEADQSEHNGCETNYELNEPSWEAYADIPESSNYENVLRTAVMGMLMLWILMAFIIWVNSSDDFQ